MHYTVLQNDTFEENERIVCVRLHDDRLKMSVVSFKRTMPLNLASLKTQIVELSVPTTDVVN